MSKTNAKVIVTGAGVAALATAVIAYSEKKQSEKKHNDINASEFYAPCPTCGAMVNKHHERCSCCNSPLQVCASCGHLFSANARCCPECGTESEFSGGGILAGGITYKLPINEPFPTDHVSHAYCCCGTPFAENAKYCQLCGRKRPKPGAYFLREYIRRE